MKDEYVVKESNWVLLLTVPWVLLTSFFIVGTILTWHEGMTTRILMIVFCLIFAAIGMLIAMATVIRELHVVEGANQLIYRTMFGKKKMFYRNDISHVELRYIKPLDWEYYIILDNNGNKLCTIETHMMHLDRLFLDLERTGIPVQ